MIISKSHRRYNPLRNEWILVSPQRNNRPWKGQVEKTEEIETSAYDTSCNLCPGNMRSNGQKNPSYTSTFVFQNDFPALISEDTTTDKDHPLFTTQNAGGKCRVVCFSPLHNITLAQMDTDNILQVINTWIDQYQELCLRHEWIQIFENKGASMGASNPHPHSQIWASDFLPTHIVLEDKQQEKYYQIYKSPLLSDYVKEEIKKEERIVEQNKFWVVVVPFWAVWPYETLLLPRFDLVKMQDLTEEQKIALSEILKIILVKYDNLFEASFPYSMGIHEAPVNAKNYSHWQFHIHFNPPLLRSTTVRKFMVGYEMFAEAQRDVTPEQATEKLKQLSSVHYKTRK